MRIREEKEGEQKKYGVEIEKEEGVEGRRREIRTIEETKVKRDERGF